jgi:hypothetical protein
MTVIGVVLMVAGWLVMSYTPDGGGVLGELRRLATEQGQEEGAAGLKERLPRLEPPFRVPGQLMVYAGIALFAAGCVQMWRQRPEEEEKEHPGDEEDEP